MSLCLITLIPTLIFDLSDSLCRFLHVAVSSAALCAIPSAAVRAVLSAAHIVEAFAVMSIPIVGVGRGRSLIVFRGLLLSFDPVCDRFPERYCQIPLHPLSGLLSGMLLLRTLLLRCFIIDSRSFQSSAVPVARAELCRFFRTSLCCFELAVQSRVRLAVQSRVRLAVQSRVRLTVQSRVRLTVQSRVLLTLQTLLDPEHSYVLGAENHMCWGKASIIQELEAPTPLSRKLALALAACSAFGQMIHRR